MPALCGNWMVAHDDKAHAAMTQKEPAYMKMRDNALGYPLKSPDKSS
jgi:hypothetical protein